jgi:hypothetical protein
VTDEAPKPPLPPATPSPGKTKSRAPVIIYWTAYAALIVAAVGGSIVMGALGFPAWLSTIVAAAAIGVAVWFLEDSALNPRRDIEKDPFNRGFFALNLHMLRAWRLRIREVQWKETRPADLPPAVASAFKELLGVTPEVSAETDGLLWVAGERDWHGWPDPPRFVIVGFDPGGKVKAADDLHTWPKTWAAPAGTIGKPKQS